MRRRLIAFDQGGFVFSPFVDVAVNGMAAMFVFLAVYVAVVPPRSGDPPPLQLVTDRLPDGVWYTGYQAHLSATGGAGQYTFGVEPSAELETLRLFFAGQDGLGWITGTPRPTVPADRFETREFPLRVSVSDLSGQTDARELTLKIVPVAVGFDPEAQRLRWATALHQFPDAWAERSYEFAPAVLGGIEPYELRAEGLPNGLTVDSNRIVGTVAAGAVPEGADHRDYFIHLAVQDQQSALFPVRAPREPELTGDFPLRVHSVPRIEAANALPALAHAGQLYFGAVVARGGRGPLTWQVAAGELPSYLRLDQRRGMVEGSVPVDAGDAGGPVPIRFTVQVDDEDPSTPSAVVNCEIKVVPAMRFIAPR